MREQEREKEAVGEERMKKNGRKNGASTGRIRSKKK